MDANGVCMVAIGLEQLGADEFVQMGFFDGEVYVDEGKKTYQDMGYKRYNWLSIWVAILSRISRNAMSESRSKNIDGNLSGDGLQNGGLLIVDKGGVKVLLNHHEDAPADHVANDVILTALGITEAVSTETAVDQQPNVPCSNDECSVEPPPTEKQEQDETCTEACAVDPRKSD